MIAYKHPTIASLKRTLARVSLIVVFLHTVGACSFFEPHKIAIQQGNLVSSKALAKLELGMNKDQVSYLLGTPLAVDTFDPDYWIYNYSVRKDTELLSDQRVKLRFSENKLTSIEAQGLKLPPSLTGEEQPAVSQGDERES